jgi:putative membrane protein
MKTLVLNVDRDDDFGRKAKVKSPIVGIRNNIEAANKLGQVDPEDSDLNAIFSAISAYNELKQEKKDVEITTICGHMSVGIKSDEILAEQLEHVIKVTEAEQVILITDGAEDEYILPIIESRIKITSVKRVTVKQSKELEDTYYRIIKLLDDEKVQKQFFLPIALVLIVGSIFILLDMTAYGLGAILLTLGGYLLMRVFRWERYIAAMWEEIKSGFLTGKLSIYTSIIAIAIIVIIAFIAIDNYNKSDVPPNELHLQILFIIKNMIWGTVLAGLIFVFGRVVDTHVRDKENSWKYWIAPFTLFALGFIMWAVSGSLFDALINWPNVDTAPFSDAEFILYLLVGIMIAFVGGITYRYIKDMHSTEEDESKIEKETKKHIEKT